jgi:hypothetical protein
MAAQDYGNIDDYLVNGDNYQRVMPDGNVLVIAGQYGQPPLVAVDTRDTYRPISQDCTQGNCGLFAHDVFSGLFALLDVAAFDGTEEDCLCALASMFLGDPAACIAKLQAYVDSQTGQPLFNVFPQWILAELNLLSVEFSAVVAFDYWFIGCYGPEEIIVNLPQTPPSGPPPTNQPCRISKCVFPQGLRT